MEFSEADIARTAGILKSMGHPMRLSILCFLGQGPACVQEINRALGSSQSNISQHLEMLSNRSLLVSRKEGSRVFYTIRDVRLLAMMPVIQALFCPASPEPGAGGGAEQGEEAEPWKLSPR